jgi:sensor histidine kinase YesM
MKIEPGKRKRIDIIQYLLERRVLKHILFWLAILIFFTIWNSSVWSLKKSLILNFIYLCTDIPVVYIILYFLWPKYFMKNRLLIFFSGMIILYSVSIFYARIMKYHVLPLLDIVEPRTPLIRDAAYSIMVITMMAALALVFKLFEENYRYVFREEETMKLKAEAELRLLRFQINPHFLFNSLISIQGLMYHNTKLADKMLTELSEFLRYTLRYNKQIYVPLKNEIDIIEKYFDIEKIRFGDKLHFTFRIDPEALDIKVLCFILQPLVENAIKHGMKSNPEGVTVFVQAEVISGWLTLTIMNTGKLESENIKMGTGIKNVRERLENAYRGNHKFGINQVNDWVHAIIKIKV